MGKITVKGIDVLSDSRRHNVYDLLREFDPKLVAGPSPMGSSYYKTLLTCPREFGLRNRAMLAPDVPREHLVVGWLFHVCLQYYYEAIGAYQRANPNRPSDPEWLWGGSNAGMKKAYEVVTLLRSVQGYGRTADTLQLLLDGYFERYDRQDKWRIVAVEVTLQHHKLGYSARLDLLVHDLERGGLFIVEHKTARQITSDLIDNYQLDLQILGQAWLFLECVDLTKYPRFMGIRINIATKHKTGSQTVRLDVYPSQRHLLEFERSVVQYKRLLPVVEELGWPKAFHCSGYSRGYSQCQFYDICHGHPLISVDEWSKSVPPEGFLRRDPLEHNPIEEWDVGGG